LAIDGQVEVEDLRDLGRGRLIVFAEFIRRIVVQIVAELDGGSAEQIDILIGKLARQFARILLDLVRIRRLQRASPWS